VPNLCGGVPTFRFTKIQKFIAIKGSFTAEP